jgi:hypothetical protein
MLADFESISADLILLYKFTDPGPYKRRIVFLVLCKEMIVSRWNIVIEDKLEIIQTFPTGVFLRSEF